MRLLAFILFFLGLHTNFTFYVTPTVPIPATICLIGAVAAAVYLGLARLRQQLLREWRIVLFLFLAVGVTLTKISSGYASKSILGVLQLTYSLGLALLLSTLLAELPQQKIARWAQWAILLIAVAASLEMFGPLKPVSDAFRQFASPNWYYDGDYRDLDIHGRIRSKVFSPEPSTAAISLYCLSMVFLWTTRLKVWPLLGWVGGMVLALVTIGSPIIAIGIMVGLGTVAVWWLDGLLRCRRWTMLLVAIGSCVCALAITIVALGSQLLQRVEKIQEGDVSFSLRVTGSAEFTAEFIRRHPVSGLGVVGDMDMLIGDLREFYTDRGDRWISLLDDDVVKKMVSNNVAVHFIYWGGVFGLVAGLLLGRSIRVSPLISWLLVLFQLAVLWMTMGGYNTPTIWCMSAAIVVAARTRESRKVTLRQTEAYSIGKHSQRVDDSHKNPLPLPSS